MRKRFLRKVLTLTILPFLFSMIFLCNSAEAATGSVVVIDGVNPEAMISGTILGDSGTTYIYAAIDTGKRQEIAEDVGTVEPFVWNNDPLMTGIAAQSLADTLRSIYSQTNPKGAPLVVLTHSWGTVLAYIALKNNL